MPQLTTPTRTQRPDFKQVRGPPESPCRRKATLGPRPLETMAVLRLQSPRWYIWFGSQDTEPGRGTSWVLGSREVGCWTWECGLEVPGSFTHLAGILVALDVASTQIPREHYVLSKGHIGAHMIEAVTGVRIQQWHPYSVQRSPLWEWHWGKKWDL